LSATLEVSTPELKPGLRLLGFLDAGWLRNNSPNGTTKPSSDSLASVGLGLRYAGEPFAVSLEYGRLVSSSRVPLAFNSAAPQRGDDRVYVNLFVRF
jgi:hemolysin activation/secretion protein